MSTSHFLFITATAVGAFAMFMMGVGQAAEEVHSMLGFSAVLALVGIGWAIKEGGKR